MEHKGYDYSKRFQLHAIDAEGRFHMLCAMPTLGAAAGERWRYPMARARYYVLDELTGNKCSTKAALSPEMRSTLIP
jgi:hypothetical protein